MSHASLRRRLVALGGLALLVVGCATGGPASSSASSSSSGGQAGGAVDETKPDALPAPPAGHTDLLYDRGGVGVPEDAPDGGTLKKRISARLTGFNWVNSNDALVDALSAYVTASIAERDPRDPERWIPDMARRVTANEARTVYIVHLREGLRWRLPKPLADASGMLGWLEDGRELSAEDFVFTVRMFKDPKVEGGGAKSYYEAVESVEALDSHTLRVEWKRRVHHSGYTTLGLYPMPKWLYTRRRNGDKIPEAKWGEAFNDHWANQWPIGSGPYRVVEYRPGKHLTLERNPSYHRTPPPIERIRWELVFSTGEAYRKLKSGALNLAQLSFNQYTKLIKNGPEDSPFKTGELRYRKVDELAYYYIGWNQMRPLFADRKVRLAMTHALDRQWIVDEVFHGLGRVQTGPFPQDHAATNPKVEPWPFDLDKARRLLEEAGWKDSDGDGVRDKKVDGSRVEFSFTLLAYNMTTTRAWTQRFRKSLQKIGVEMRPRFLGWPEMKRRMRAGSFDAYTGGWSLTWNTDPYQIWHSSQVDIPDGSNRVGFRNERADALIEKLRKTFDHEKRIAIYRKIHTLLHEQQPYTFLYNPESIWAWRPELRGVEFRPFPPQDYSVSWYFGVPTR